MTEDQQAAREAAIDEACARLRDAGLSAVADGLRASALGRERAAEAVATLRQAGEHRGANVVARAAGLGLSLRDVAAEQPDTRPLLEQRLRGEMTTWARRDRGSDDDHKETHR
ncbi:MAG TPA: hypothetical protein VD931_19535 [Baekduia sp.]|nr:hypothetical protein [Baekduia sp.]